MNNDGVRHIYELFSMGLKVEYIKGDQYKSTNQQGVERFWLNRTSHNAEGPSAIYPDGTKFWCIMGDPLTEKEHKERTK